MGRMIDPHEQLTRQHMINAYKRQSSNPSGFDDWGNFTAHVVHALRVEIGRLRARIEENKIDPGDWNDPMRNE